MLAPNQVSAPAAIHTSSIPAKFGTARLTSDGCTKIDEPTMVPTTIAVACTMPIDRVSCFIVLEDTEGTEDTVKPQRHRATEVTRRSADRGSSRRHLCGSYPDRPLSVRPP